MESLNVSWDAIAEILEPLRTQKFRPDGALKKYYQEGHGRPGLHFFKIRYAPGKVIMGKAPIAITPASTSPVGFKSATDRSRTSVRLRLAGTVPGLGGGPWKTGSSTGLGA